MAINFPKIKDLRRKELIILVYVIWKYLIQGARSAVVLGMGWDNLFRKLYLIELH